MAHIILASSSPRRRELLQQLGLNFDIHSPDIDESVLEQESVKQYVERLACTKAEAVFQQYPNSIIIAADTTVAVDHHILGKPESKQHAFEMWQLMSGRKHNVFYWGMRTHKTRKIKYSGMHRSGVSNAQS